MPGYVTSEANQAVAGLCKIAGGKSAAELSEILSIKRQSISWHLSELMKAGIVFRGGAGKNLRYFGDAQKAAGYTLDASEQLVKSRAESTERNRLKAAERSRATYARKKAEKARQSKKVQRVDLSNRDSGLVIATKQQEIDHKRFHAQANVVWPENVKVTIIPTGVDTRFMAFVEPGKGQISRDWMANRKLSART